MSAQVVTIPPKGKRVPGVAPKSQRSARFSQQAVSAATRKPCPCRLSAYEVHEYGLGEDCSRKPRCTIEATSALWRCSQSDPCRRLSLRITYGQAVLRGPCAGHREKSFACSTEPDPLSVRRSAVGQPACRTQRVPARHKGLCAGSNAEVPRRTTRGHGSGGYKHLVTFPGC